MKSKPKLKAKTQTIKRASATTPAITPRTILLASVGAASIGSREAIKTYSDAVNNVITLPDTLRSQTKAALRDFERKTTQLQKKADMRLAPVKRELKRLRSQVQSISADAQYSVREAVAPVLERLGISIPTYIQRAPVKRPAAAKKVPAKKKTLQAKAAKAA